MWRYSKVHEQFVTFQMMKRYCISFIVVILEYFHDLRNIDTLWLKICLWHCIQILSLEWKGSEKGLQASKKTKVEYVWFVSYLIQTVLNVTICSFNVFSDVYILISHCCVKHQKHYWSSQNHECIRHCIVNTLTANVILFAFSFMSSFHCWIDIVDIAMSTMLIRYRVYIVIIVPISHCRHRRHYRYRNFFYVTKASFKWWCQYSPPKLVKIS